MSNKDEQDRLLTKEEMRAINDEQPSTAKYGDVFMAIAQAQRDLTASIKDAECAQKIEQARQEVLEIMIGKLAGVVSQAFEVKPNGNIMVDGAAVQQLLKDLIKERQALKSGTMPDKKPDVKGGE